MAKEEYRVIGYATHDAKKGEIVDVVLPQVPGFLAERKVLAAAVKLYEFAHHSGTGHLRVVELQTEVMNATREMLEVRKSVAQDDDGNA